MIELKMIPIAKPQMNEEEIQSLIEVLRSGMLAQGKVVEEFEQEFASIKIGSIPYGTVE